MKEFDHPAMFPEELPRRLMKLFSYKNDIVLDPFNGAGTTTLVAAKQGRRFIGIDVSEQYLRDGTCTGWIIDSRCALVIVTTRS